MTPLTRPIGVTILALALLSSGAAAHANPVAPADSVDAYVRGLDYDNRTVLAVDGDKITSIPPAEGKLDGDRFTVISRTKRNLSTVGTDISTISAGSTAAYPGALVLADRNLLDSRPTLVQLPRSPLTVSVDLPGLSGSQNSARVQDPHRSSVNGAVNTILDRWITGPGKATEQPARFQYTEAEVFSQTQLAAKFGYSFNQVGTKLGIDFEAAHKGERRAMVASFKQIFYTASVDEPGSPASFFAGTARAQDLRDRGVSAKTPPAYIASVDYGRQIYVKLDTDSTSTHVKAAFDAALKGHTASASAEVKQVLKNTNFTALVVGGSASGHSQIVTGRADALKKAITDLSVYGPKNPGVPISYSVKFLKDNAQALVKNTTDYTEVRAETSRSGRVTFKNAGAFVARFNLTWDEVSYDAKGNRKVVSKAWENNGVQYTAVTEIPVNLPANAVNLQVRAEEATGLAWEPWRTVIDRPNLPLTHNTLVTLWGTTLYPAGYVGEAARPAA